MSEIYKFFNDGPGDIREYQAADFADYFGSVLSTGFLHTNETPGMAVSVVAGTLNTKVSAGKAIMRGHLYENTADLTLTHSIPEPTLDRIDRVVLRLDLRNSERNIKLRVKEGVAAATPVAPTLQRDNFIYEISLARVLVRKNTVQLLAGDLVDERLNEAVGGLVHSLISIPTEQFQAQWDEFMAGIEDSGFASAAEFATHKADEAAHGIGNKATLATTHKSTIVGAINEAFQQANDIKGKWASVVGSPLLAADTQAQMQTKTQTIKNTLATNLTNKGQTASGTETLTSLANKVANVNTGKRWASGSTATVGGKLTITGLSFRPKYIIMTFLNSGQYYRLSVDVDNQNSLGGSATTNNTALGPGPQAITTYPTTINNDGFITENLGSATVKWIAFE